MNFIGPSSLWPDAVKFFILEPPTIKGNFIAATGGNIEHLLIFFLYTRREKIDFIPNAGEIFRIAFRSRGKIRPFIREARKRKHFSAGNL